MRPRRPFHPAFTLAELLIVLAILGVVATFTVPKILYGSRTQEWNAKAKEAAAAISEAYALYRSENIPTAQTKWGDILKYINSAGPHNGAINRLAYNGDLSAPGNVKLYNGAVLWAEESNYFSGTSANHALWFYVDPDGKYTDGVNTPQNASVNFFLYFNGRITTTGNALNPTHFVHSGGVPASWGPNPSADPTWFSWN